MNYWLMKSEPDVYGIEHLQRMPQQTDHWDGIRNYQVRNMLRDDFKPGDMAFFYHSNVKPVGIVGTMEIVGHAYPDFTAFDPEEKYYDPKSDPDKPRWFMVDVQFKQQFSKIITLDELRANPALEDMLILRKGNRLSITPVTARQWQAIMTMAT